MERCERRLILAFLAVLGVAGSLPQTVRYELVDLGTLGGPNSTEGPQAPILWKQKTPYSQPGDWVFPSFRLEGKQPRVANMLVEDHLRPATVKAGILSSHRDLRGQLVDDDPRRFEFSQSAP